MFHISLCLNQQVSQPCFTESLIEIYEEVRKSEITENHLRTISSHNIMCYFHISILFPAGLDTKKQLQFGLFTTGVRRIIFTEAHFE